MACGAKLNLASKGSERTVALDSDAFLGYKQTCLKSDEILVSVFIPFTKKNEYVLSYKQSRRRQDDLAIVNAGLRVVMVPPAQGESRKEDRTEWKIGECSLAFGGMSYKTVMATKTQQTLVGREWNETTLQEAIHLLSEEFQLPPNAPGGMPEYHKSLTVYPTTCTQLHTAFIGHCHMVPRASSEFLPSKS
jgi:xanthine dehydrogenase/oxidase